MKYRLILYTENEINDITLACIDEITLDIERKGSPATLKFSILLDLLEKNNIKISEGNTIEFYANDYPLFKGYVFKRNQENKNQVDITAYDQTRYLKNNQSYTYTMKKASDVVKFISSDFKLEIGEIADTGYTIASRDEDNQSLFDIILTALELTLVNTGEMYVLYDDFGKITLKNIKDMVLPLLLVDDDYTLSSFSYSTDIDTDTYNRVKLYKDSEETGKREVYIAEDSENIAKWGVLQHYENVDDSYNEAQIKELVNTILQNQNRVKQTIGVEGIGLNNGEVKIRGGSGINVKVKTMDGEINKYFIVEKCTHTFKNNEHTYKIDLLTS